MARPSVQELKAIEVFESYITAIINNHRVGAVIEDAVNLTNARNAFIECMNEPTTSAGEQHS